jgi:uncharacterized protein (TIGR02328 family)
MRLWHQDIISKLPRQQLLGQHRECCALRGNGWGRNHSVVNYVFEYHPAKLVAYHYEVMNEMKMRGYNPNEKWYDYRYRGKNCSEWDEDFSYKLDSNCKKDIIYPEHDDKYMNECTTNLEEKGVLLDE